MVKSGYNTLSNLVANAVEELKEGKLTNEQVSRHGYDYGCIAWRGRSGVRDP